VLYGDADRNTWEWDGAAWSLVDTVGPMPPRQWHSMTWDPALGVTVLFGGTNTVDWYGDTWTWNGTTWSQLMVSGPSPRSGHATAYDTARGELVLFGGRVNQQPNDVMFDDTWLFAP
jgi:hypothetical protein